MRRARTATSWNGRHVKEFAFDLIECVLMSIRYILLMLVARYSFASIITDVCSSQLDVASYIMPEDLTPLCEEVFYQIHRLVG